MPAQNTADTARPAYLLDRAWDKPDSPFWADIQAGEARKEIEAGRLGDAVVSLTRAFWCVAVAEQHDYPRERVAALLGACEEIQGLLAAAVAKSMGQTVERS